VSIGSCCLGVVVDMKSNDDDVADVDNVGEGVPMFI